MRVACVLDSGFEDSEFQKPHDAFRAAGHEVVVIGSESGSTLEGKGGEVQTQVETSIESLRSDDFDALFIPGGYSPDHLRANPRFVEFTRAFFDADKPVFAVCHGPQLLMAAHVVDGRTLTAWETVQEDLRYTGATVVDEEVVVDGNLVTSRQPDDLDAFTREALHLLDRVPVGR